MPTGYTGKLYEGEQSFNEFVWSCARAFGAMIHMREDGLNAKIVEPVLDVSYYEQSRQRAEKKLAEVDTFSDAEVRDVLQLEYENAKTEAAKSNTRSAAKRARYEAMVKQVSAWTPPSPEHAGLRTFMLDQLRESIKFDCDGSAYTPKLRTAQEWRDETRARAQRDLEYANKEEARERKQHAERVAWMRALQASVPLP
jgi:hypothetical protein